MIKSCKKCRREGDKLMLKGDRCFSAKCAIVRRPYAPGQHGPTSRTKLSEFGRQLREKQKVKKIYGLSEKDLSRIYATASKSSGNTAETMTATIESRIDNLVYRCGVGTSRSESRQIVAHNHVLVDARKLSSPSAIVHPGHKISFDKTIKLDSKKLTISSWIKYDEKSKSFEYLHSPSKDEIDLNIDEKLVVEFYSR